MSASTDPPRAGTPRPRPRGPRKVTLSLALLMAAVGLLVGVALGYTARTGPAVPPVQTVERDLPVVTVTP